MSIKSFQQDKKQLVFARASLILTSYFLASEWGVKHQDDYDKFFDQYG